MVREGRRKNDHSFKGSNKPGVRPAIIRLMNTASLLIGFKSCFSAINVHFNKEKQESIGENTLETICNILLPWQII